MASPTEQEQVLSTAALWDEPTFSDVVVKFGDKSLRLHKVVLSTKSEYFKRGFGPKGNLFKVLLCPVALSRAPS